MGTGHENLTDEDLILLYKKEGDVTTLGKLYDPYMPMVYGVCLKYLKNREESRDAVMHIFEKLVTTLKAHEVIHFKSWLYVTSRNYCLMALRSNKSRKLQQITEGLMETEPLVHPDSVDELEINIVRLEKCIDELTTEQKQCVQLFFLQQRCYKEITVLTGFDDNKVKSYIQNGKRNLKICMERNA
jgi:RNA polymerase sigma factor (sigma-70 family)